MKVEIWVIGKTKSSGISSEESEYLKRLKKFIPLEYVTLPEIKSRKSYTIEKQKEIEGREVQKKLGQTNGYLILMDALGNQYTSKSFAVFCNNLLQRQEKRAIFLIGGPYGFSREIEAIAKAKVSLSKMTLTHDFARLLLLEQLYRAMTILNNMPYHH